MAVAQPEAPPERTLQAVTGCQIPGEDDRRGGLVLEPTRQGSGAVPGRKEPDPGPGSHAIEVAPEERSLRYDDARLQAQRHHHAVCGARRVGRPGDRRMSQPAPAPGMVKISTPPGC